MGIIAIHQVKGWVQRVDAALIDPVFNCKLHHIGAWVRGCIFVLCAGVHSEHVTNSQ